MATIQTNSALIERAARTAHEVNRIYSLALGDTSHERWEDTPEPIRQSAIAGARYLARHPGTTPAESHAGWMKYKVLEGWQWGADKDLDRKTHPCLVPYESLPVHEKLKDSLFQTVVRGVLGLEVPVHEKLKDSLLQTVVLDVLNRKAPAP
jgi:hypothetical protein